MDDIDLLLREAGERWRASQPTAPKVDAATFTSRRSAPAPLQLAAVAAVLAVVFVGTWTVAQSWPARDRADVGGSLESLLTHRVAAGDRVAATGQVIAIAGETPTICIPAPVRDRAYEPGEEPPPSCSPMSVPVVGLDLDALPGWTSRGDTQFSAEVEVRGQWTGEVIEVEEVEEVAAAGQEPGVSWPPVPCTAPSEGWPSPLPPSVEGEAVLAKLSGEVSAHTDLYVGMWTAVPTGAQTATEQGASANSVVVVGTTEDPTDVEPHLRLLYPYALCVTQVPYSAADLRPIAERLARPDRTWQAEIDPAAGRVRVRLIVLDDAAAATLADVADEVVVEPFVRKAG